MVRSARLGSPPGERLQMMVIKSRYFKQLRKTRSCLELYTTRSKKPRASLHAVSLDLSFEEVDRNPGLVEKQNVPTSPFSQQVFSTGPALRASFLKCVTSLCFVKMC